jgi:hypothetical protein
MVAVGEVGDIKYEYHLTSQALSSDVINDHGALINDYHHPPVHCVIFVQASSNVLLLCFMVYIPLKLRSFILLAVRSTT